MLFVPCVTIPTIITPNHDGYNDTWVLAGLMPGSCAVEVYNRWGKQVYTHARYANDWGTEAAPGLYYYLVQHAASGRSYKGWVEVVR